ncbi:MAG: T9SS type A sorting domain-containing protein [Flavobacteriales bacterium]|nr:T9SS type A sorting domain-containing protein [Flavobacteriales bacterium]
MACLTNAADSPMVYTNGIYVANLVNDTMLNGAGLNPSIFTDQTYGLYTANSHIILPWPNAPDSFALFHMATDGVNTASTFISQHLYMSVVDMALDGGLGGLASKNQILAIGEFCTGGVSAVKHANGRDWWVLFHRCTSDEFVKFLLTPDGLAGPYYQQIGMQRIGSVPSGVFSPDGSHFAYLDAFSDLDVFDYDRCTGELNGLRHAAIDSSQYAAFAAYSPSGRFLYVTWVDRIYQYDTQAADLQDSRVTVAVWDSTYDPVPPFALLFMNMCLAPDGKIYVSTGNVSRFLHIIDQPDSLGLACNVQLHAHSRQTYTDNSIPYRPNYHLGPLAGSLCDTLGLAISELTHPPAIVAYPNPNSGTFVLRYPAHAEVGELKVFDLNGRCVLSERIPQWSSLGQFEIEHAPSGIYECRITWTSHTWGIRLVLLK